VFSDIAALWTGASLLMNQVVEARGGAYFHVLQPNQYYTRRRFGAAEAAIALNSASPYKASVENGYPALIGAAPALTHAGVAFIDATSVFDGVGAAVYMDDCCHYTLEGTRALADLIAASILASPGPWGSGTGDRGLTGDRGPGRSPIPNP
jgi:hypothetical protein